MPILPKQILENFLITQRTHAIALAVTLLFGILLLVSIVQALYLLQQPTVSAATTVQNIQTKPVGDISKWHIFGTAPDLLPNSNVQLTLIGVFAAETGENSQAILATPDGAQKNYVIGQTLPGGAILKKVLNDGIVIERDGNLEKLSLPKPTYR